MRILACLILAALSATALASAPARAQTYDPKYPVCIQVAEWGGLHIDCSFTSIAQCAATGAGRGATCFANPYSANASDEPQSRGYRRHRRAY